MHFLGRLEPEARCPSSCHRNPFLPPPPRPLSPSRGGPSGRLAAASSPRPGGGLCGGRSWRRLQCPPARGRSGRCQVAGAETRAERQLFSTAHREGAFPLRSKRTPNPCGPVSAGLSRGTRSPPHREGAGPRARSCWRRPRAKPKREPETPCESGWGLRREQGAAPQRRAPSAPVGPRAHGSQLHPRRDSGALGSGSSQ